MITFMIGLLFTSIPLFWLERRLSFRRPDWSGAAWLLVAQAALIGGLFIILAKPANGFSYLTLTLQASNVWQPQAFSALWLSTNSNYETPLTLLPQPPRPITFDLIATGQRNPQATHSQIWLAGAFWADGTPMPLTDFTPDNGWEIQKVNQGRTYRNQPVWVSYQHQPATLHGAGNGPLPLTLLFARHDKAGQVTIRLDAQEQTVDLYAPSLSFQSITLPPSQPLLWQAQLPLTALTNRIGLAIQPDPNGQFVMQLQQIRLTGLPWTTWAITPDSRTLEVQNGTIQAAANPQLHSPDPHHALQLWLQPAIAPPAWWGKLLPPLEIALLILLGAALFGLGAAWLAQTLRPTILINLNLLIASSWLSLALMEGLLHFYLPPTDQYFVRAPYQTAIFTPDLVPGRFMGINGQSYYHINSQGVRGDEFSPQDDYRILAIGGSTTECQYLDQAETWTALLQSQVNQAQSRQVWVGNVGRSGNDSREHLMQLELLTTQYPRLDAVVILIGINDLQSRLSEGDLFDPDFLSRPGARGQEIKRAFQVYPNPNPQWHYYEQTSLWQLGQTLSQKWRAPAATEMELEYLDGRTYDLRRQRRQTAPIVNTMPDLTAALEEYERNLNALADLAQQRHLRLIFMTQPTMWRPNLTAEEAALLWFGSYNNPQGQAEYFYSVEVLAHSMQLYNDRLLQVCATRQLECLDLATQLPKDTTILYDDVHFNEGGARQVATLLSNYLLQQPPLYHKP